jgi:DNA primase
MFDKDVSGFHAIQSAYSLFSKCPLFVALYPKGKSDPAEMSRKEVEYAIDKCNSDCQVQLDFPET